MKIQPAVQSILPSGRKDQRCKAERQADSVESRRSARHRLWIGSEGHQLPAFDLLPVTPLQLLNFGQEILEHFPRLWPRALFQEPQCLLFAGRPTKLLGLANLDAMHLGDFQHRHQEYLGPLGDRWSITSRPYSSQAACMSAKKSSRSLLRDPSGRPGPPGMPLR